MNMGRRRSNMVVQPHHIMHLIYIYKMHTYTYRNTYTQILHYLSKRRGWSSPNNRGQYTRNMESLMMLGRRYQKRIPCSLTIAQIVTGSAHVCFMCFVSSVSSVAICFLLAGLPQCNCGCCGCCGCYFQHLGSPLGTSESLNVYQSGASNDTGQT